MARALSCGCFEPKGSSAQNRPLPPAGAFLGTRISIANASLPPGAIGLAPAQLSACTSTWPAGTSCWTYAGQRSKPTVSRDVFLSTTTKWATWPRFACTGGLRTEAVTGALVHGGTALTLAVSNGDTPICDGVFGSLHGGTAL